MRRLAIACVWFVAGRAAAEPAANNEFETCKANRLAQVRAALEIADPDERGRRLATLLVCQRDSETGTTAVVDQTRLPPSPTAVVASRPTLQIAVGAAAAQIGYHVRHSGGYGGFAELEAGWQFRRAFWVAAFGSFASYDDPTYLGMYDVSHRFYELGARAGLHFAHDLRVGAGFGVELDDGFAFSDVPGRWDELLFFDLDATYQIVRMKWFRVFARAELTFASTTRSSTDLSLYGDVLSGRAAVGVSF